MNARTFIYIILWVSAIAWSITGNAQDSANDTIQVAMYVKIDRAYYQGDSIPNMTLHEFYKTAPKIFKNEKQRQKYNKLVRDVRYVFPYAKLTRQILIETHDYLETIEDEKEKKRHIKAVERGIRQQYEPTVRKITKTQGKLLVKLIDRECGQTSFEMIKAFLARQTKLLHLFGYS